MFAWYSVRERRLPAMRVVAAAGAALAIGALGLVYGAALMAPAVGGFHDDGIYAVTAKALATGHGYSIFSLPGDNRQTKYPFLFPALLAVVWKLAPRFPENVIWLKTLPLACAVMWWYLSYRLIRRETRSPRVALVVAALVAASPWVLFLSTALMSETLFAALVTGALILVGRLERGTGGWREIAAAGLLAGAAFLTRTAGIALLPAGALSLAWRGRRKKSVAFVLVALAVCAPWVWWQLDQSPASLDSYYSRVNYENWNIVFHFTGEQKWKIVSQNLVEALIAPGVLMGSPATGAGALLALVAGALAVTGLARRAAQRPGVLEIFVVLYSALIIGWAWPPMRFFAPLLPVMLLYGYQAIGWASRGAALGRRTARVVMVSAAVLLAAQAGWVLAATAVRARVTGSVKLPNTPEDDWREMTPVLRWLGQNTPPDAVLMGNLDPVLYLYTERKSVRGFTTDPFRLHYAATSGVPPLGSAGEMLAVMRHYRVTYLVCAPNRGFREGPYLQQLAEELVERHPDLFHLAYRSGDGQYRVYAVLLDHRPRPN